MSDQEIFLELLDTCVTDARIGVFVNGSRRVVGSGRDGGSEPEVSIRVHQPRFFTRVLAYRNLGMGEAFMDGDFDMADGTLEDLLIILLRNRIDQKIKQHWRLALKVGWIGLVNRLYGKHRNVQRHYDVGDDLFESFLDRSMAYSCGYAVELHDDAAQLQVNKFDRICRKLNLRPGDRLLDIGCGFGGLLIHAATHYGIHGMGVTNSRRHCERGNANIAQQGLAGRVRIEFKDYGSVTDRFDRVVSVGMMEHVPRSEYRRYIRLIDSVLEPQGMGLIHAIGCNAPSNIHDPFIQKYIFPGSGQPKLSEIAHQLEQHELPILDVDNIGRHYEFTARVWLKKFLCNRDTLDRNRYDETFLRMWEYYLCCGIAAAAAANDSSVYQVLFTKGNSPLPIHRV